MIEQLSAIHVSKGFATHTPVMVKAHSEEDDDRRYTVGKW